MKKIPSLFKRDYETHRIYNEITEGCEWVIKGEGIATRKYDGTACMVRDGTLYKRYDVKKGRLFPASAIPCELEPDPVTGHWPFWVKVTDCPEDRYHREAFTGAEADGTYELCGPKVNSNPEGFATHELVPHGIIRYPQCPRSFDEIREFIKTMGIEGIVWYHPDGRMCKVKLKDYGIKRKVI